MNQTQTKLEQLLKISLNVSFDAHYIVGSVCLKNESDCDLIKEFEGGTISDVSFDTQSYNFDVGNKIDYRIALHHTGQQFASYENFIFHQFDLTKDNILHKDYVIYEEKYLIGRGEKAISETLKLFSEFIKCLSEKYYHRDNQIILFSKSHCEILIQPRNFREYVDLAKIYKDLKLSEPLSKLIEWLVSSSISNDEVGNTSLGIHQSERYAIAATEFVDHLITCEKKERIFLLLKNVDSIYQSTISKYSLYLEDFKYSKFTDKITKYSDEFLSKVNKTISDLQNQILAIPLTLSVITIFKKTEEVNVYIYLGFLVYLILVFYASCQQAYNLRHIELQIKQFNEVVKLPKELAPQWKSEITPVNNKILWHKVYLIIVAFFIGVLIGVCILNISFLNTLIDQLNPLLFFTSILILSIFLKTMKKNRGDMREPKKKNEQKDNESSE